VFQDCVQNQDTIVNVVEAVTLKYTMYKRKRSTRILERFQKYTVWLQNMSSAIDIAVQTQAGIACPVWTPIKFVLRVNTIASLTACMLTLACLDFRRAN